MPSTHQTIVVEQPIQTVWEAIRDFHDMSWTPNVITKLEPVGDKSGTEAGAKRLLNDAFHDTLIELNAGDHRIRYSIDDGPSPISSGEVSNYVGEIQLTAEGEGATLVEWSSTWESDGEDVVEFCHEIYVALLGDLQGSLS